MIALTFPVTPMGAPRQTRADSWKKRPVILRYRAFKSALRRIAGDRIPKRPTIVNMVLTFPMPDSWSKKKKQNMFGEYHQQKPDWDNCAKAVMDALWPDDDSFIAGGHVVKRWGNDGHIELVIYGDNS